METDESRAYRGPALTPKLLEIASQRFEQVRSCFDSPTDREVFARHGEAVRAIVRQAVMETLLVVTHDDEARMEKRAAAKRSAVARLRRRS